VKEKAARETAASDETESTDVVRDLVERVETTRFLGSEFLVWLWFKTELFDTELELPDGTQLSVWLDSQLAMKSASDAGERIQFTGVAPSASSEAKLALRLGKLPVRARVCLRQDPEDFSCVYDAETFSFGSVKLPALIAEPGDEQFRERVTMLERFDRLWNGLYAEFLSLRLSPAWERDLVPAVKAWAAGAPKLTVTAYRAIMRKV
jgi:hypothetical protein